jgi:hypothetical protein
MQTMTSPTMTTPTSITWTITALNCLPLADGVTNYAITAHWTCSGTDGSHSASVYNTCAFPPPTDGNHYTPYADLSQAQVLGWCWANGVDQAATEAAVQAMLAAQINPPIVTPALPWAL